MTYKFSGNDPNKSRKYKSPEEVKAMLMGGGGGEEEGLLDRSYGRGRTMSETLDEEAVERALDEATKVVELAPAFKGQDLVRAKMQGVGRCHTCGRKFDCICQNCRFCGSNGKPRVERRAQ